MQNQQLIGKKKATIVRFKDEEGSWIEKDERLKGMAMDFFKNLFPKDQFSFNGFLINHSFPELENAIIEEIENLVNS